MDKLRAAKSIACLTLLCLPACDRSSSSDEAAGAFLQEQTEAGDDELWQVEPSGSQEGSSAAVELADGERAAFLEVDARAVFAGAITAGDRVDFVLSVAVPQPEHLGASKASAESAEDGPTAQDPPAQKQPAQKQPAQKQPEPRMSLAVILLQNVLVLDASPVGGERDAWMLSVAVTPKEAGTLRLGALRGQVHTLLRHPNDEDIGTVKRMTLRAALEDLEVINRVRKKRQSRSAADTARLDDTRLAGRISAGGRAMALPADLPAGLVERLGAGDRVDISVTLPINRRAGLMDGVQQSGSGYGLAAEFVDMTLLQNVRVLETRSGSQEAEAPAPVLVVDVSIEEAEMLALAGGRGEFDIVRRRKGDDDIGPVRRVTWSMLTQGLEVINRAREKRTRRRAQPTEKSKSDEIQILRGGSGSSKASASSKSGATASRSGGLQGLAASPKSDPPSPERAATGAPAQDKPAVRQAEATPAPVAEARIVDAGLEPRSTFALDVDTSSYTLARRHLSSGELPPPGGVRVEEYVNYFDYADAAPTDESFAVSVEGAPSPFRASNRYQLLRIGVHARAVGGDSRRPLNLTALVDTSSSMRGGDRIGMIQTSLIELARNLGPDDTISIVGYGGEVGVVLNRTAVADMPTIMHAVRSMEARGATDMEGGMRTAFRLANFAVDEDAEDRVIIFSDGDPNVGADAHDDLLETVADERAQGITLSTIGFGRGNYRDTLMEQLANQGDGNSYFIDDEDEIKRLFDQRLLPTLVTVARDAKAQVEFDPDVVESYRRIGYDNREMTDEQWYDPTADAGEVGAGHQVTVMYEVKLAEEATKDKLGVVRLRYKQPSGDESGELSADLNRASIHASFAEASADFRFAASVVGLAEVLAGTPLGGRLSLAHIERVATDAAGDDPVRAQFVELVERARKLRHDN